MAKSSRSDEIIRARDQLHDGLTFMRKVDASEDVLQVTSALAAGLSILVGIALDLNRIADASDHKD